MKKKVFLSFMMLLCSYIGYGQTGNAARDAYEQFRQNAASKYNNFREQANQVYADFMENAWKEFEAGPATPMPKYKELKPMPIEEWNRPIETRPITIEEIVKPVIPKPQPFPIEPIKETPAPAPVIEQDEPTPVPVVTPTETVVHFTFYGTPLQVRFDDKLRFSIKSPSERELADKWRMLSSPDYNNTIYDCIQLRTNLHLSDWAYLLMLNCMAEACVGKGNSATFFMAYIFCQTGYQMRLGIADNQVIMLYGTDYQVYDIPGYQLNGIRFYPFKADVTRMYICDLSFPKEQRLSLNITGKEAIAVSLSQERLIKSASDERLQVRVAVNKNLIDFYNDYPTSMYGGNLVTRWAMYANVTMQKEVRDKMYPQLREMLKKKKELDAVGTLLSFVQWGLIYKYDDEIWGGDRAFFPEETLFYPYADCEDRSILFSRLVRDLFGLKVLLVYYPGHLATAVHFTENVPGDYILLNGLRYTICDPTYFGASVGMTMDDMDNQSAKVILLD